MVIASVVHVTIYIYVCVQEVLRYYKNPDGKWTFYFNYYYYYHWRVLPTHIGTQCTYITVSRPFISCLMSNDPRKPGDDYFSFFFFLFFETYFNPWTLDVDHTYIVTWSTCMYFKFQICHL